MKNISLFTALYSICMRRIGRDLAVVRISSPRMNNQQRHFSQRMNDHFGLCTHWYWCCLETLMQLDAIIDDVTGWQSQWRHRLWRRVAYEAESCVCLAVHAHSTLACITGALWARRYKRGILSEARDEGRRKNKAPVKSPLFSLFPPPTPTNIEWHAVMLKGPMLPFWLPETPTAA